MCVAARQKNPNCAGIVKHLVEFGADVCTPCPPDPKYPYIPVYPYDVAVKVGNKIVADVSS